MVNAKYRACSTYYIGNLWFEQVCGGLQFRPPAKMFRTLVYSSIYKFALRMGTSLVMMTLAFKTGIEVDWDNTAPREGFVCCDYRSEEVLGLEVVSVQVVERVRGGEGSSTTLSLAVAPVSFRVNRGRVDISDLSRSG